MAKTNWKDSIYSDGSDEFVTPSIPKKGQSVSIKLRMFEDAPVNGVVLKTRINGAEIRTTMEEKYCENGLKYYEAKITSHESILKYSFYIFSMEGILYYNQMGLFDYMTDEVYDFRIVYDYRQPKWVKNAVFYQIFPDRFCNGDKELTVKDSEYKFDGHSTIQVKNWNTQPWEYDDVFCLDFYGGDLVGIKEKIPYLKELGVTALYLNPIFYAATTHRYDCLDYFKVDPHLGGDDALIKLVDELHKNDMRIILDVSINHTGIAHKWFNKDGVFFDKSEGAYNNKDSETRNYYFFDEDNNYKSWWNTKTLPTLNYASQELRQILYKGKDSLVKKWLKPPFNTDGWRFDVADVMARSDEGQFHHEVWPELVESIKNTKEDAYVVAEEWGDCSDFMNGNEWDTPMNYMGCSRPVREFVGEADLILSRESLIKGIKANQKASCLSKRIREHYAKMPFSLAQVQFNLLNSHDVSRLHNNPTIPWDNVKAAIIMLFTLPGASSIYYGDELNIDGRIESNEGFRYPMPWDKLDNMDPDSKRAYNTYQTLAKMKSQNDAFTGGFKIIYEEGKIFAFARFHKDDVFYTVCSMEEGYNNITLPYDIFGKKSVREVSEIFGNRIEYIDDGNSIRVEVPAKKSFVIHVK